MNKIKLVRKKIYKVLGKRIKKYNNKYLELTYDIYYSKYKNDIDKYYNLRYKNIKNDKKKNIITDMIIERFTNKISFEDYCLYDLYNKNDNERKNYLFKNDKNKVLKLLNKIDDNIYDNKYECYKKYKDFYKREVVLISENDFNLFEEFCNKYKKVVKKTYDSSCGKGIELLNTENVDLKELFNKLINQEHNFILEELIIEKGILSKLHKESVNTIRVTPFIKSDNSIELDRPFIKVGRDNSFVDNGGAGGILASIDKTNGTIYTNGFDEACIEYIYHPNSKIKFKGLKIDHWDELLKVANDIAKVDSNARYIGWDMAYTDKGWVVIEGNRKPMYVAQQLTNKKGLKKEFYDFVDYKNLIKEDNNDKK